MPLVGFFGALNPTDGGNSQRYSLQAEWHRQDENSETKIMAYGFYYDLDLFSDFTYFLNDPVKGDQFEQQDRRWVAGLDARHTIFANGLAAKWKILSVCRSATIGSTTACTARKIACARTRMTSSPATTNPSRMRDQSESDGRVLPADTDLNKFTDTMIGFYAENKIQWTEKFRSVLAVRGDEANIQRHQPDSELYRHRIAGHSGGQFCAAQFRHGHQVSAQPQREFDFRPVGQDRFLCAGRIQFSQQRRARRHAKGGADFAGQSFSNSSIRIPALVQTKGAEVGVRTSSCRICKALFRSGISTAIPNSSRTATPEPRWLRPRRATAMASNGPTTTRPPNIWFLILIWRIPARDLPKLTRTTRRLTTLVVACSRARSGRQAGARSGSSGDFIGRDPAQLQRFYLDDALALFWPARFDLRRIESLRGDAVAKRRVRLSI